MNNTIKDQLERERIENDLDTSFLVEAGAGSGKTTSMVKRMIALIKYQKAKVDQIAAITFTNKATSELKSRFITELEKAAINAESGEEAELLKEANEKVNQCFIGTIHSFCGSLLRERPLEAGLDPSFTELDEEQAEEFFDQCWDEYLTNLVLNGETSEFEELTSYGVDSETLRTVYHRMVGNLDVSIFTKEVDYPNFDKIRGTLLPLIEEAKAYFPTTRPNPDWDKCQKTMLDALQTLEIKDFNDDMTVLQLAHSFDKKLDVTLKRWTDTEVAKEFRDERLPDWQEHVLRPFLRSWREFIHPKIVHFVIPAIEYCQARKQERGLVDFQDLLLSATRLLRDHVEVRNYFKQRFTHLLVDEFQDTDPVQAEMMLLLTGEDVGESDWKKQVPKAGTLFIVGDPKQSIYRFRRADISTYHFVMKKIVENGEVLRLTSNFRSVESIGHYVDNIFESKFLTEEVESPAQAIFAPMNTVQSNPEAYHGIFSITHPKVNRNKASEICEMDSAKIASFIAWACQGNLKIQERISNGELHTRGAHPGDFLILLKRKDYLHIYAEKLEQFGILSDITGSSTRYEELLALVQLVKTLDDHHDAVALLAVLRGMLFGCSDEDLYQYKRSFHYFNVFHLPKEEKVTEETRIVYDTLLKLQQYHRWVNQMPALTAFLNIIEDLGLLPYSAVQDSGLIRAGTIVQIIDLVQADPFTAANWNELSSLLLRLVDEEKKKGVEGTGLFLGSSQAVRIMNLHKAKGLEAPVVFLAAPVGETEHPVTEHVDRMGDEPTGYFAIVKDKKVIAEPFGWVEKEAIEVHFKKAEEDRLLYVAATRPKQILVFSQYPENPKISPWTELSQSISLDRELSWEVVDLKEKEVLTEAPDLSALLSDWNLWLEKTKKNTFEKTNVTTLVKGESETVLPRSKDGRGPIFGTVIHRCMEELGKAREDMDLEDLVSLVSEEEGLIQEHQDEALQTVQTILGSEIWRRGQQAVERYHEFSFIYQKENEQLQGVIDFLFKEEDGWVIVDYKTDTFKEADLAYFVEYYRGQVELYSKEFEEDFDFKVKEKGLYFTTINRYVEVK
ncbi:exodeoxyribonuclease V subunit beta [Bacillus sp. MRMR6]|uniref:UvrD-helicase domain-containing protein n=1 Tax=Bacillus sp. MRMR6 TaxID=1928617 RepID=UPI0009533A3C|nr:UvrD-helicase domain-containing protein [Bacillus sp. MRMR6]OLS33753.1 hypothetical protein BTR25_24305 [Bacillus sp. MRMR6]